MAQSLLLQAFKGTNKKIPVWFMRQAGRYLPEYQKIKGNHSLEEMFQTPEIASEITCLPVGILNVDAAILFADILTLPKQMGFDITFEKNIGPVIKNLIQKPSDIKNIKDFEDLPYLRKTIALINQQLADHIPLIGFAGSPFTVAIYLIEGGSSVNFFRTLTLMNRYPEQFHQLMETLTKNTIKYLNLQKDSGIKVFQLFDTWAGVLRPADFAHFVLPYVKRIFQEIDLPSVYFVKGCSHLLSLMDQSEADFLSVCQTVVLGHDKVLEKTTKGIQGNLFNGLLYSDLEQLKKEVEDVLLGAKKYERYIFNLSHGIFPDVDVEKLKFIVEQVHEFRR